MSFLRPQILLIVSVICLSWSGFKFDNWLSLVAERNFPVVTGTVKDRIPLALGGPKQIIFKIEFGHPKVIVHARTQRSLRDKVPDQVKFHYSGDPEREVFLFEHEANPLWSALALFAISILLCVAGVFWLLSSTKAR